MTRLHIPYSPLLVNDPHFPSMTEKLIKNEAFYYGGYGALLMPWMGVVDSYGGKTIEYYNAFGLYLCGMWS